MRTTSCLAAVLLVAACSGDAEGNLPELDAEVTVTELAVWDENAWQVVPDVAHPESSHPYRNGSSQTWTIEAPACAQAVRLRFSTLDLEEGFDHLILHDGAGNVIQSLTGRYASAVSQAIPGHIVKLKLVTDYSVTGMGFAVSSVEAVEGGIMCPAIAIPRCADGTVDVNGPAPMCGCPSMPTCESLADFSATLLIGGGFTGASSGHMFTGDGHVSTVQQRPGAEPRVEWVANMSPQVVQDIARQLIVGGFFDVSGVSGEASNMTNSFTATFRGVTRTVQWPVGGAPAGEAERFAEAINHLRKSVTCEPEEEVGLASECREGYECQEGACVASSPSCATVLCPVGTHCEMRQVVCVRAPCNPTPQCIADDEAPSCMCTEQYAPVCGSDGVTYGNACHAGCAQVTVVKQGPCGDEGDPCGGIAAFTCSEGERCRYGEGQFTPPHPDAMGVCVAHNYCDAPADCGHLPHAKCLGSWSCAENQCSYACTLEPVESWERRAADFGSGSPYGNDAYQGWRVSGPAGTQALRVSFASFDLEDDYDFVVLYDWAWNEVARYTGDLGAFVSANVEGPSAFVVFSSDSSITRSGFRVDAVELLVP